MQTRHERSTESDRGDKGRRHKREDTKGRGRRKTAEKARRKRQRRRNERYRTMENVEDFTPYSRQKEAPAIHYYGKRRGFHALRPTEGDPSETLQWKTSRISRLTAARRRPQRYITMENVQDYTPYGRQKETPAMHYYGKRPGIPLLQTDRRRRPLTWTMHKATYSPLYPLNHTLHR